MACRVFICPPLLRSKQGKIFFLSVPASQCLKKISSVPLPVPLDTYVEKKTQPIFAKYADCC